MLGSARFRVYTSDEIVGIELGGALKNIFAIPAGVSDGFGFGDNSKAGPRHAFPRGAASAWAWPWEGTCEPFKD